LEILKEIAISQVPRILGFLNKDQDSKKFGCFDRYYWHYKIIDFANSRFQEAALLLALLYNYDSTDNPFRKNNRIRLWIDGAIDFWAKIQLRDGSFNEVYPFEHSFIATAFSTFAVSETMLLLQKRDNLDNLLKAGNWIAGNNNLKVSNQMAAAIAALYNIYLITSDEKFRKASKKKLDLLLSLKDPQGFFPEYGGYDIGYSSICLGYLVRYYTKSREETVLPAVQKTVSFLESKINEYAGFDLEKTSRKTQYIYPYAFAVTGSGIFNGIINGLKKNKIVNPLWMDDRFCLPLTIDYLQTYLEIGQREKEKRETPG